MSAPVRASLNLQPLLPLASPTAPSATSQRPVLRRRMRRLVLAGLAAFLVVNAWLASRALYRAWQLRGFEREQVAAGSRTEHVITKAGAAADNAVTAAMDSAAALSSAASAAKHTAQAAGQAAGAAVGAAAPVAANVAAAVGSAASGAVALAAGALNGSAATNAASGPKVTPASFTSNGTAGGSGAAEATAAAGHPHRQVAELPPVPAAAPASNDSCAQALGIPKVALLFLTYGEMAHEAAWRLWLDSAAGLVPRQAAQAAACQAGPEEYATLRAACAPAGPPVGPLDRQHLFSVYVHAPPSLAGYPVGSVWQGRLVSRRVNTSWGDISLVEAARNLLWEAFKDPLNQRFVLVSESDVPLYDPLTLHQQLLAEGKSRVNACNHTGRMVWRWSRRMETEHLKVCHWRKSGQFFGLTRSHVEAVLRDQEVFRSFERGCWSAWDPARNAWRDCYPDEHYIPTLLAVLGRDNETECGGWGVAAQDWSAGGSHPKEFKHEETTPALLQSLRDSRSCNSSAAFEDAQRLFVNATSALGTEQESTCQQLRSAEAARDFAHPMQGSCPLTARKFPVETAPAVLGLLHASCATDARSGSSGSLNLLSAAFCQARQAERHQR